MNKSADWMDIKHQIISRAPTQQAKRAIWCLLLGAPALAFLVGFLNPVMLELNSKQLTWLQIYIALFAVFVTSVYLNFHLYFKLITLGKFIDNSIQEMPEKITAQWIYKNAHPSLYVWFFGLLVAAISIGFGTGVMYSSITAVTPNPNLSKTIPEIPPKSPATTAPMAIENIKPKETEAHPKSIIVVPIK